jgi:hypothetical protein
MSAISDNGSIPKTHNGVLLDAGFTLSLIAKSRFSPSLDFQKVPTIPQACMMTAQETISSRLRLRLAQRQGMNATPCACRIPGESLQLVLRLVKQSPYSAFLLRVPGVWVRTSELPGLKHWHMSFHSLISSLAWRTNNLHYCGAPLELRAAVQAENQIWQCCGLSQ